MERSNLSIASELMMPALSLTKGNLAVIFNSFLLGYAIFQVPAGWLGDTFSPRLVLAWSALAWGGLTLLTGFLPAGISRSTAHAVLILWLLRFLLGAAEASTFPVAARAVQQWVSVPRRGFGNSLMLTGSSVASAITAPFVSWSMLRYGWRASFYLTATVALAVSFFWFRLRVPALADDPAPYPALAEHRTNWLRPEVLLLSVSYISEGYLLFVFVSWLYIYLVEVRHFSLSGGGLIASLPWIAAIAATPLGGYLSDFLALRYSRSTAARSLIIAGYTLSGVLLLAAAMAPSRTLAVLSLSISLGALYLAESSFWTTATLIARGNAGAVAGLMNTLGILGGMVSNSLVPVLVGRFGQRGWILAFASGTAMGLFCAAIWLFYGRDMSAPHAAVCP